MLLETPRPVPHAAPRSASPAAFAAAIFDMDGVVTDTAAVHSQAWKRMFDEYLRGRQQRYGGPFLEFTHAGDYLKYVDGRPRYHGVAAFLESRGIRLPDGDPTDAPGRETCCGLGNRKNELFNELIATAGVQVYASTLALIDSLRAAGVRVGLATSSRNSALILARTRTLPLFATVVDGLVAEKLRLHGKPEPDIFLRAAADLEVAPANAIVFEDAVSGVRAAKAGRFALVVGLAREHNAADLQAAGADVVVSDLGEISLENLEAAVRTKREAAQ